MKRKAALCFVMLFMMGWPARAATYDLSGDWALDYTALSHTGPCPAGVSFTGTATIAQTGDAFTLTITSGTECIPAFTCVFEGTVADAVYTGSNSGDVPDGGTVENTMVFTADSESHAAGTGGSTFTLDDMTCTWESSFVLSREVPGEEGAPEPTGSEEEALEPVPDGVSDPVPEVTPEPTPDGAADTVSDGPGDDGGEGGCGCALAGRSRPAGAWALLLLLAAALALRPGRRRA